MFSTLSLVSFFGAGTAIVVGLLLSPIPKNLGFYRFLASKDVAMTGLIPAFHHGIEWGYDYEKHYSNCENIKGQNALITGGNSGVGYETAKALSKCGVHVTLACRNTKKCAAAVDTIKEASKVNEYENEVIPMIVDMSSLKSVQSFCEEYLARHEDANTSLDMLYLNAGIISSSDNPSNIVLSEDGIELVFATNYVGHHLMYRLLEPMLKKSKMARVIQTSSAASFETFDGKVPTSLDELNNRQGNQDPMGMKNYGQSKLAQILWTNFATKRLGNESNIYFNAVHPGAVNTAIWDKGYMPRFIQRLVQHLRDNVMWTAEEGALTQLYLGAATDDLTRKNIRGKYFHPQAQEVVNPFSLDDQLQEDLWKFSEKLLSEYLSSSEPVGMESKV